jgi:hypothetical protein
MFALIVGFAALIVASCAAYFSVQGLASLYAGQFLAVCIMAGSLEFGKLVAASYLDRYWKEINFLLKSYLILSVIILMGITSLGVFGFLTSSFQQSHVKVEIIENQKNILDSKKLNISNEIENLNKRIDVLNQARLSQEKRLPELSKKAASPIYEDIKKSGEEIKSIQNRNEVLAENLKSIDDELLALKEKESKSTDIGTLRFIAETFNIKIELLVKWLTLIIVLVFDPLAVSLVLAYNNICKNKKILTPEKKIKETDDINYQMIHKDINVKYKDK